MTKLCFVVGTVLYLILVTVALRPGFDLEAAGLFHSGPHHFVGDTRAGLIARYVAWATPFAIFLALLAAAGLAKAGRLNARFAPTGRSLLMLAITLVVGPGIIVHAVLKEISHRPRPYSVTQFGGTERFRPFYRFDGSCPSNCSFPSGETAAATWTIAPASLVPPPYRAPALALAFAFAAATGLWRMALGAHFLSDICGAALIVIVVVLATRALLRSPRVPPRQRGGRATARAVPDGTASRRRPAGDDQ